MSILKLYDIIEGPIFEMEKNAWYIIAKVEDERGGFEEQEIDLESFEEGIELVSHFKGQIIPYTLEVID